MKKSALIRYPAAVCMAAALLLAAPASAQQPGGVSAVPGGLTEEAPQGLIRVTVLMVSMPEEKFLDMRPDLLDSKKIEKTIPGLLDAVKRKEIKLEGFPMVVTKSGQRAVVETEREVYEEYPPPPPNYLEMMRNGLLPAPATPTTLEKLNPGQILEVEPVIWPDGVHIDLNLAPQHYELLGFRTFTLPQNKDVAGAKGQQVHQPIYHNMKTVTSICLLSCHHALLGVFKKPQGGVEIFIIGAEVLDVGGGHP
ncbi:MAG TPA: hypothetical protein VG733_00735 [Chthoniobacteraceae bacterium]|nr:hypothetical protein [Chthoniobacteraceae bacterium]